MGTLFDVHMAEDTLASRKKSTDAKVTGKEASENVLKRTQDILAKREQRLAANSEANEKHLEKLERAAPKLSKGTRRIAAQVPRPRPWEALREEGNQTLRTKRHAEERQKRDQEHEEAHSYKPK